MLDPPADSLDESVHAELTRARQFAVDREFQAAYRSMLSYSGLRDRQLVREQQAALDAQREAMEADERRRVAEMEAEGARRQRWFLIASALAVVLLAVAVAALLHGRRKLRDMNDQLTAQRDANRALAEEREVLIREVHHRVKGNLQIITSLLNLQLRSLGGVHAEAQVAAPLRQTRWRVEAIALVHEQLHRSETLREIDAAAYLRRLVGALAEGATGSGIDVEIKAEAVMLDPATAVPLGLVVAELVGNVYKHAFPEGGGAAAVRLGRVEPGRVCLVVEDAGRGLPVGLDETMSLGVRLVRDLAVQLDGTLHLGPADDGGTRAELVFPLAPGDEGARSA